MRRISENWKSRLVHLADQITGRSSAKRGRAGMRRPSFEGLEPRMLMTCNGSVSLSVATLELNEATAGVAGTATVTVTLGDNECSGEESATVVYSTTAGTATSGSDYIAANATITLTAASTTHQINIPIVNDLIDEPNESFTISLSNPVGTTLATGSSVTTVTITDNDNAPEIRFGSPVSATEGATQTSAVIQIPVSLYDATGTAAIVAGYSVTVSYTIAAGSASTPADFSGALNGTLTFDPGVGTVNIPVTIIGDDIDELDETFLITLSNPSNATLPQSSASTSLVTITDDDGITPISTSGCALEYAQRLQGYCEECAEALLYGSTVNMYYGSYQLNTSYLFHSEYSSYAVDVSSFYLPIYDSSSMGLATIDVIYTLPDTTYSPVPSQYSLDVTLKDASGSPISTLPTVYYTTSGESLDSGDEIVLSVQLDPSTAPDTGYYRYDAKVTAHYASSIATSQSSGSLIIVNRRDSEYGAGWTIDGLDRVYEYSQLGLALVRSDGTTAWFPYESFDSGSSTTTYTASSPGNFVSASSTSTLVTLVTKFNEKYEFDKTSGRLVYSYDPAGNKTTFNYSGGLINYIEDPFQRRNTFAYSSGVLNTITDFSGRVVDVDITSGQLTQMLFPDPDGAGGEPQPDFDYAYYPSSGNRYDGMLRYIDTNVKNDPDSGTTPQRRMELIYSPIGQVNEVRNPDYSAALENWSRWQVESADYQKLAYLVLGSGKGLSAGNPASIVPLWALHGTYVDELGAGTHYFFDGECLATHIQRSAPYQASITTTLHRNSSGLVDYIDEQDPDGDGPLGTLRTYFTYDARGNLRTVTHPDSSVLTLEYDTYDSGASKFGIPTKFIDEEGRETRYAVNSTLGVIDTVTQVVGEYGGNDDIVTSYTYSDGTTPTATFPKGMVLTVTEDLTDSTYVRTDFAYFTSTDSQDRYKYGRIDTITRDAANGTPSLRIVESYEYDADGFLKAFEDGLDQRTEITNDHLGRPTKITQPYPKSTVYGEADEADGSSSFTKSGSWSSPQAGGYDSFHINIGAGTDGAYAEFKFEGLVNGTTYEVFGTWPAQGSGATAAQFTTTGETVNLSATANQSVASPSDDPFDDAYSWKLLGNVVVSGDTLTVRLSQNENGTVAADAVRIVQARPVTTLTYNAVGDLLTATDPLGNVTKTVYDLMSRPIQVTQPNPGGGSPISKLTYDLAGNIRTMTNPLGAVTEYQYDTWQRMVKALAPYPSAKGGAEIDDAAASITGTWTEDGSGRYATNGGGTKTVQWTFSSLEMGQPFEVLVTWDANVANSTASPYIVNNGTTNATVPVNQQVAPPSVAVLGGNWKSLGTFTPTGTTLTVSLSNSVADRVFAGNVRIEPRSVTTYTYDKADNVDTVTDPLGNVTDYDYDNRHRLIKITEPAVGGTSPVTQFAYYKDSQLRHVVDPLNRTTRYVYNKWLPRLDEMRAPHASATAIAIKDENDASFPTGTWTPASVSGTYDGDHSTSTDANARAEWSFASGITAGSSYEVFATWKAATGQATQAPTSLISGATTVSSTIDQTKDPADDNLFADGTKWQSLGVITVPSGQSSITVRLDGQSGTTVVADAVRLMPKASTTAYAYDQASNVQTVTDPLGNVTTYAYDNFHRMTQRTDPDPGPGDAPIWKYAYDKAHNLVKFTDPFDKETDYAYDALGRLLSVTLPDADGASGKYGYRAQYAYSYDARGQVLQFTDALGRKTSYEYDSLGRPTEITPPTPAGFSAAPTKTFVYDLAGRVTDVTEQINNTNSRTTRYVRDALGRIVETHLPDKDTGAITGSSSVYRTVYDVAGNVVAVEDALGATTTYEYDDLLRLKKTILPDPDGGGGTQLSPITEYFYDLTGQVESLKSTLTADSTDSPQYDYQTTDFVYDRLGRQIEVHLPDKTSGEPAETPIKSTYAYDLVGNLTAWTNPLGETTEYFYDNLYRLWKRKDPDPDNNGSLDSPTTEYTYDLVGKVTSLKDANNNVTEFAYDFLGRLDKETIDLPVVGEKTREYTYDAVGNLTKKVDRNGRKIEYSFDELNRLKEENWFENAASSTSLHELLYSYDLVGNVLSAKDDPDANSSFLSELGFAYDRMGRAVTLTSTYASAGNIAALAATLTQVFDADSRRTELQADYTVSGNTYDDFKTSYLYDELDRITTIKQEKQGTGGSYGKVAEKRVDFAYRADGRFDSITRYTDVAATADLALSTFDYYKDGRLKQIRHEDLDQDSSDTTYRALYDYEYDDFGRLVEKTESFQFDSDPSPAQNSYVYTYDDTNQIKTVDRNGNTSTYTYDENGNRLGTGVEIVVNGYNRLDHDATYEYLYDNEGNMTFREKSTPAGDKNDQVEFGWDHRNRLVKLTYRAWDSGLEEFVDEEVFDFTYDALDRRIRKARDTDPSTAGTYSTTDVSQYILDGWNNVLVFERDAKLRNRYLHGPAVDQILADEQYGSGQSPVGGSAVEGTTYWALTDDLGSVRQVIDNDGNERKRYRYDAWGNTTTEVQDSSFSFFYTWTGRERETGSHLQYNRGRYYDPRIGRWTSEDPIGFAAGDANLYRYVGNSPTNFTDPSGLQRAALPGLDADGFPKDWKAVEQRIADGQLVIIGNPDLVRKMLRNRLEFTKLSKELHVLWKAWWNAHWNGDCREKKRIEGQMNVVGQKQGLLQRQFNKMFDMHIVQFGIMPRVILFRHNAKLGRDVPVVIDIGYMFQGIDVRLANPNLRVQPAAPVAGGLGNFLDNLQMALDVAGMVIPGAGDALDLVNGGISLARGNWGDAAMSFGAAIPFAGAAAGAAKLANRFGNVANAADATADASRYFPLPVIQDACFVAGTEVWMAEEYADGPVQPAVASAAVIEDVAGMDRRYIAAAALVFAGFAGPRLAGRLWRRRKRRPGKASVDTFVHDDFDLGVT